MLSPVGPCLSLGTAPLLLIKSQCLKQAAHMPCPWPWREWMTWFSGLWSPRFELQIITPKDFRMCQLPLSSPASSEILFFYHFLVRSREVGAPQWNEMEEQRQGYTILRSKIIYRRISLGTMKGNQSHLTVYIHEIFYSNVFTSILKNSSRIILPKQIVLLFITGISQKTTTYSLGSKNLCL